jgi:hypothetical protein
MNKRISVLAEQATNSWVGGKFFDRQKFAELIIRECAEVCKKQTLHYAEHNNQGSAASAADACYILIKRHFKD